MSNILPKKSWHVYNDKNKEKVRKDETSARIEKEKSEERAKAAEREHRLTLLRSKANLPIENKIKLDQSNKERFELFSAQDGNKDEIKGDYEKELEFKKLSQRTPANKSNHKNSLSRTNNNSVEVDHAKNDPMYEKTQTLTKKKSNSNNYSFV